MKAKKARIFFTARDIVKDCPLCIKSIHVDEQGGLDNIIAMPKSVVGQEPKIWTRYLANNIELIMHE